MRDDGGEPADGDRRPADLADEAGREDEEAAGARIMRRRDQADGDDPEDHRHERTAVEPEAAEVEAEEERQRRPVDEPHAPRIGEDRVDDKEGEVDEPGVRRPSKRRRFGEEPDAHGLCQCTAGAVAEDELTAREDRPFARTMHHRNRTSSIANR